MELRFENERMVPETMPRTSPQPRIWYLHSNENGNSSTVMEENLNKNQLTDGSSYGPFVMPVISIPKVEEQNSKASIVLSGTARKGEVGPAVGAVDIGISKSAYFFQVALPGVKKDPGQFSCEIEQNGIVHVRGETSTGGKIVTRHSRVFEMKFQQQSPPGPFTLSFSLPGPVDPRLFYPNFRSDGMKMLLSRRFWLVVVNLECLTNLGFLCSRCIFLLIRVSCRSSFRKSPALEGMGLFTDSYDLFCIPPIMRMIGRIYYPEIHREVDQRRWFEVPTLIASSMIGVALMGDRAYFKPVHMPEITGRNLHNFGETSLRPPEADVDSSIGESKIITRAKAWKKTDDVSCAFGKVGAIVGTVGFLWVSRDSPNGQEVSDVLMVMGGVCVLGLFVTYFFTRETMGRSLEENENVDDVVYSDLMFNLLCHIQGFWKPESSSLMVTLKWCILLFPLFLHGIIAINLGDSGFMIVDGCTVFRSPAQQHDFNFTYQLEMEVILTCQAFVSIAAIFCSLAADLQAKNAENKHPFAAISPLLWDIIIGLLVSVAVFVNFLKWDTQNVFLYIDIFSPYEALRLLQIDIDIIITHYSGSMIE
ncbi:increased DNA methylation 3-like protein [Tanacetum coccineum]